MVSILLILITIAVSMLAWRNPVWFDRYSFRPFRIEKYREYYRFITNTFLHTSWSHLFFNLFTLFFFGPTVERQFDILSGEQGWMYLLLLYGSAMVVSEMGTYFKYRKESRYSSVGASGAVSAVLFSSIWFAPSNMILVMIIPMPGFAFGAIYLIYTAWAAKNDLSGQINHDAHFYGSVWGAVFSMLFFPASIENFFRSLAEFRLFG